MKFKCPQCATGYNLPDNALPKPKEGAPTHKMRCVRCKATFIMSVELAAPGENRNTTTSDSAYFELFRPGALPQFDFDSDEYSDRITSQQVRVKYDVHAAPESEKDTSPVQLVRKASEWADASTLDLTEFETFRFQRAARAKAGVAGIIVFVVVAFILYVAAMNDWTISINTFGDQLKRAFFLQSEQEKQNDVNIKLDVRLTNGYPLRLKKGRQVGVVEGEIQNNSLQDMEKVMLEGRLLDPKRQLVASTVVPCGVTVKDKKIKRTPRRRVPHLYMDGDVQHNCQIRSGFTQNFKVIFDDIPADYNDRYRFQVHIKTATPTTSLR